MCTTIFRPRIHHFLAMNETYFPPIFLNVLTHLHEVSTIDGEPHLRTNSDLTSDKTTASKTRYWRVVKISMRDTIRGSHKPTETKKRYLTAEWWIETSRKLNENVSKPKNILIACQ